MQESKWLFPDILGEIIKRFGTFPGDIPGSVLNGFHSIFDGIACFFGGRFSPQPQNTARTATAMTGITSLRNILILYLLVLMIWPESASE